MLVVEELPGIICPWRERAYSENVGHRLSHGKSFPGTVLACQNFLRHNRPRLVVFQIALARDLLWPVALSVSEALLILLLPRQCATLLPGTTPPPPYLSFQSASSDVERLSLSYWTSLHSQDMARKRQGKRNNPNQRGGHHAGARSSPAQSRNHFANLAAPDSDGKQSPSTRRACTGCHCLVA